MKILTDHKWKRFKYRHEVPRRVLAEDFDWLGEEDVTGYFKYRNRWYHLRDFMGVANNEDFAGWDGYVSDSFFSGVLIKVSDDGETYKVATYFS